MAGEVDKFGNFPEELDSPASGAFVCAYSDATDFAISTRALYFGAAGKVAVVTVKGQVVTIPVVAGGYLPIRVKRINSTNTTVAASSVIGLY
jgi:hypothetical protein